MRQRPRLTWIALTGASVLVIGVVLLVLWQTPTSDFLFEPGSTRNVDALVKVEGEDETPPADDDGIYMVDIAVRHATVLERLLPFLREDGTIVPEEALNPEGVSDEQRGKADRRLMTQSQRTAAAVALQALGYKVEIIRSGADVALVLPGSPAETAGIEPGDVIVEANGEPIDGPEDLHDALVAVDPGEEVELTVSRDGARTELTVGTRAAGDDPGRAVMGVEIEQAATIELPVEVAVDAKGIGGPSAGLAFALEIVDELGPDVDQRRKVVVTGKLSLDGRVLPIGGIKQKTIAAREEGADVFVVPRENAEEAERYAGELEIVPVGSFDEALRELGITLPELVAS